MTPTRSRSHGYRAQQAGYVKRRRVDNWPATAIIILRARSKKQGWPFDLEAKDIAVPARCPVFGTPIVLGGGRNNPDGPSVDRIHNIEGYVKGNVIVVSYRANRLKGDATPEELRTLASFYASLVATG